ncbi:uncharacterized protein RAG0_16094 [Rhynchosporium agropyri]|uniref:Reverse transcriptase domain-containing protein n=1 Tax=Rhynchosporium agropyri TaxID=914238 RepID=A0A1E1LNW9_9HELO|nr:uncharacterized protein RAG0_16094 [Rhynchosporium agropyri]
MDDVREQLPEPYRKFSKLFEDPQDMRALLEYKPWDHEINFKDGFVPIVEKLRYYNYNTTRTLEEYRELVVKKAGDPKGRPCGDYRMINSGTIRDNNDILKDFIGKFAICYLDDILVYSETIEAY